jgi:pimeloyl-ACP methyl ester carboxylesterase
MSTICALSLAVLLATLKEPNVDRIEIRTSDGAVLQGLRHPGGETPVILLHGLVSSLHQFDLDEEGSPALAQFLSAKGWDVWLFNWRGGGRGDLRSTLPEGEESWSADELIVEDLPAIIAHVRKTTGKKPHLVGHSLGGMSIAAYLAGATKIDEDDVKKGVRIDVDLARRRNAEISGAVLLSAPTSLAWPDGEPPTALNRLAKLGRGPLRVLLPARISVSSLNGSTGGDGDSNLLEKTGDQVLKLLEKILGNSNWASLAVSQGNKHRAKSVLKKLRGGVLGDTSDDLLLQLAAGIRAGSFLSWRGDEASRVDYTSHYGNITAPLLSITGSEDRIATRVALRTDLLNRIGSKVKKGLEIPGFGHSDITLAPDSHVHVFPHVEAWLRKPIPERHTGLKKRAEKAEEPKR